MIVTSRSNRRGVTAVEAAVVLPTLCLALFAMLDLGLMAMRHNVLCDIAHQVCRNAIIHGAQVADVTDPFGPDSFTGTLASEADLVASARPLAIAMELNEVLIEVTWLDADNTPHDRVRVTATYEYSPLVPGLFPWGEFSLVGASTQQVIN